MKKSITLLTIILITTSQAFADQKPRVISGEQPSDKKVIEAFADVNMHTDQFFTPVPTKEELKKLREEKEKKERGEITYEKEPITHGHGSVPPVKKFRMWLEKRNYQKAKEAENGGYVTQELVKVQPPENQAILDCDEMEYFAERTELEANGNVVMTFPKNDSSITADKLVYNQTSNLIKVYGNVVLTHAGQTLTGDYMQVDLNEENAVMDEPVSEFFQVVSRAKKGYMYGDKIIQENGEIICTDKTMIDVRSEMFGPDLSQMFVHDRDKSAYKEDSHGELFKIKTDELIINAKSQHDNLTLKNAEFYYKDKKIGKIPSITIHTNKNQDYAEASYPEIGTVSNMGMFAGPGFIFDTPGGTNLKLAPVFNWDGGKIGGGAIAKFKSATGKVDMAYGTANNIFIARGKQRLDDNLFFQYGANSYFDDWFMGFRMPTAIGELYYQDSYTRPDFLGENKNMIYTHRVAAGYMQDRDPEGRVFNNGDYKGIGTARFKYMNQVAQTLLDLNDIKWMKENHPDKDDIISARIEMVGQGSAAVYGTGDTQVVTRIGPRIHTQYKYWMQDAGYFLSAYSDDSPLVDYDRYMYGRSNVYLRESLRINKYVTLSWFSSYNLSGDAPNGELMQENSFFLALGPDDIKLNIGYDTIRQQSFVTMALALDAKGSSVEYKKMVIKNPEDLGKTEDSGSFVESSDGSEDEEKVYVQKAEVIDLTERAGI